jgi:hypothetical protein
MRRNYDIYDFPKRKIRIAKQKKEKFILDI